MAVIPPFLKHGDTVALVATARKVQPDEVKEAIRMWESWGLKVRCGAHLFDEHFQFAGNDAERAMDLITALIDPEIKAIFTARGGYGSVRLADYLKSEHFRQPKWLIGFSDVTVLHLIFQRYGWATLHGPMAVNATQNMESSFYINPHCWEETRHTLFGQPQAIAFDTQEKDDVCEGFSGVLNGGNLSVLNSMLGSEEWHSFKADLLFLEDLDEYLYHVDRMAHALSRTPVFKQIKWLLAGNFSQMKNLNPQNPFGLEADEIFRELCHSKGKKMVSGIPAGHSTYQFPLVLGGMYQLSNLKGKGTLTWLGH